MDFGLTEEQFDLRNATIRFAQENLNDDVFSRDKSSEFSRKKWEKCADFGIQALPITKQHGGSSTDLMTTMLLMEALGYGCQDQGLLFSLHAQMWSVELPILNFGTEQQKTRYLPGLCKGTLIGAHAMTEPGSGSDAFALKTRAEREGDSYTLNGSKTFVTNATEADLILAFATVASGQGMWGVSAFLVERGTEGCHIGKKLEKMGLRTSPMAQVSFENCRIPKDNLLGSEGQGSAIFAHSMAWERSCILATTVGAMQRQLEKALAYSKERRQFGKRIGDFQLVASKIVDMKVRLETSRLLLYHAAWRQSQESKTTLEPALAKLYISECAVQSALDAIQIHGGYGYMSEFEVERDLRDFLGGRLYSGTTEIQRVIIARCLGLSP